MSTITSLIEDIDTVIQAENPFDRPRFLKQEDIWSSPFPDVPEINRQASDKIFALIEKVTISKKSTKGLFISAERGLGKSHLISRVQKRIQEDGSAILIYMNECSNLDKVNQEFLHSLALSLRRKSSCNVMQWQEIATAVINEVYEKELNPKILIDSIIPAQISKAISEGKQAVDYINTIREKISLTKTELSYCYILQALLWTLSKPHADFAISWLGGRGLAQIQADAMGLPTLSEENSIQAAQFILNLIGQYKTVVICLDELDNPGVNQEGSTRAMVMAGLGKSLANDLTYGLLITTAYPQTLSRQIRVMEMAGGVMSRIAEEVVELEGLNADSIISLVSTWLDRFYASKGLVPPHPVYPFKEDQLRQKGDELPTVRDLLKWCAEHFQPNGQPDLVPKIDRKPVTIEKAFASEIESLACSIDDYLDNKDILVNALRFSFESLIGLDELIENVEIYAIEDIKAKGGDRGRIDFRIVGKELINIKKMRIKIGVSIAQETNNVNLTTTLSRLNDYKKFDLTRGCLVRSKPIADGAKVTQQAVMDLLQNKGEWVLLMKEHITPLLAVLSLQNRLEDYEIKLDEFSNFLKEKRIIIDNPLIREILSKPSGKPPKVAQDVAPTIPVYSHQSPASEVPDLVVF
jgi:hypothetical protein